MSEVILKWHWEVADDIWDAVPYSPHAPSINDIAEKIAAHDPSAELLRECAKALAAIIDGCDEARAEAAHEARIYSGGRVPDITYVGEPEAHAALARLKEAGVE